VVWAVSLSTTKLSPRRLTHTHPADGIRSLIGVGNQHLAPSPASALPPSQSFFRVAAPQCISGRTSYLHVRLEFLLYPHVIPQFCNTGEFEPRRTFTSASLCTWIAHVVSGRIAAMLSFRPLQTRFPSGSRALTLLNPQRRCTRRIILQKARHQPLVPLRNSGL
jgi:hypothetical protein